MCLHEARKGRVEKKFKVRMIKRNIIIDSYFDFILLNTRNFNY